MSEVLRYEKDENGDSVLMHPSGYWFAYAGKYQGDVYRGKGKTKNEAVLNSIENTERLL